MILDRLMQGADDPIRAQEHWRSPMLDVLPRLGVASRLAVHRQWFPAGSVGGVNSTTGGDQSHIETGGAVVRFCLGSSGVVLDDGPTGRLRSLCLL